MHLSIRGVAPRVGAGSAGPALRISHHDSIFDSFPVFAFLVSGDHNPLSIATIVDCGLF
tara:strand:- start:104 stop:280 length:177 start_codon:yes stop_codon:yes gene_type:complete